MNSLDTKNTEYVSHIYFLSLSMLFIYLFIDLFLVVYSVFQLIDVGFFVCLCD